MKRQKRLIWQLYPPYLVLIVLSLLAVSFYATNSLNDFFMNRTRTELETHARIVEGQLRTPIASENMDILDAYCKDIGKDTDTRITIILPNGKVVGDSNETARLMENHGSRPEILTALKGGIGTSRRFSNTLRRNMMYLAMPVMSDNGRVNAIIRTSIPLTEVEDEIHSLKLKIGFFGFIIALVAAVICLLISHRISRPIGKITEEADRFARGDLKQRISAPDTVELSGLTRALNHMAEELEDRIETVINQRNEYEAVLTSMVEGVVAIDMGERILSINRAASKMLALPPDEFKGRSILEAVRNRDLHLFITEALKDGDPKEGDVVLHQLGEQVMHIQCIPLNNAPENRIGTLVVLHDVTQIRRLENVRQDFVANVSHEIKTPLTAIKGFVETLQDGTANTPEEQEKFLGIIKKHADRLDAIVEDLLALARLEQKEDHEELLRQRQSVQEIIDTAVQVVKSKSEEKKIGLEIRCDKALQANVDATLVEQAIVNLLDNAIKYSPEGSPVSVAVESDKSEIRIKVSDHGPGIPKSHLPRLFERFYRVDRARSRMLGGTGLGLSIVKHIAQAHNGRVSVESAPGKGSTFCITLPVEAYDNFKSA
jgi:two-component system phosphate regulon sensor histidine kinase PhoR